MDYVEAWNFPDFGGGQTHGIDGNSAVSTFKGTALPSLAKEVIQNSLDARVDKTAPVVVRFSVFEMPTLSVPGIKDVYAALLASKSRNFDEKSGNEKIRSFFAKAFATMDAPTISIMQISDLNTTGLTNPDANILDDEESKRSRWLKLVHGMGATDKGGASGGSHGQGKSAALSNSALRTLFYSTIDINGKCAFQGVSYVGTHKKKSGTLAQSVGYYGINDTTNSPIPEVRSLNPDYCRTVPGTDIYVAGFEKTDHWEDVLLVSVLNDYLIAFWKNDLIVQIGNDLIVSKETLEGLFDRYRAACETIEERKCNFADKCLDAIKSPTHHQGPESVDFFGIRGEIEIFLRTGIGYPKSVAMVRQIGMKVYDRPNKTSAMQYVGVMYITGKPLNAFLAGLENVQHTSWEVNRDSEDATLTKKRLNAIYRYLNSVLNELIQKKAAEKMDVDGLEEFFGVDIDDVDQDGKSMVVEESSIANISSKPAKVAPPMEQYNISDREGTLQNFGEDLEAAEEADDLRNPDDGKSDEPHPPYNPPESPQDDDKGEQKDPGNTENKGKKLPITLARKALIGKKGTGEYTLILESRKDCEAKISLCLSGEDGDETPTILSAVYKNSGVSIAVTKNTISPVLLPAGIAVKISILLSETLTCAWGVAVDAY